MTLERLQGEYPAIAGQDAFREIPGAAGFVAIQSVMLAARVHIGDWSLDDTKAVGAFGLLRLVRWMREAVCALRGHDMILQLEPGRLCLCCLACGARTKGWIIEVNPAYRRRGRRHDPESPGTQLKAA